MHAYETAEEAASAADAEHTVACCAAGREGTAEEALATCVKEDTHDLGSERQEAFH